MIPKKLLFTIILFLATFNYVTHAEPEREINLKTINHKPSIDKTPKLTLDDFLSKMGFLESSNNYRKVNSLGYLGKYQFGRGTLETLGYGDIPTEEFVNSPNLQEKVMIKNLKFNRRVLREYIQSCEGECVNNVILTESGMLGAAHLAGAGNVIKFIMEGKNPSDAYGTKLSDYLINFSDYDLNLD